MDREIAMAEKIRKMIGTQMNADFQDVIESNPPFSKGEKGLMILRIPGNYLSSLWKREVGRDFWKSRFKRPNCCEFYSFLSNKKAGIQSFQSLCKI